MARKKNARSRKTRKAEVSPSTPKSSRKQRYRAKQRNSWIAFLGKLLLFFVPAALATWFLIDLVLRTGEMAPHNSLPKFSLVAPGEIRW